MYDLIIIGAGPAGMTASIYASCFHLSHVLISSSLGGQMQSAPDIVNYPGFEHVSGKELTQRMVDQLIKRGGTTIAQTVNSIAKNDKDQSYTIATQEGSTYETRTILLATGTERRRLNVPGEIEYVGKGVLYCAVCGKMDYVDKICAVIGGANSAIQGAIQLAQGATKVYIIYRGTELRGDAVWLDQVQKNPKVETVFNAVVTEILGDGTKATALKLTDATGGNPRDLPVDKIFIEIGGVPGTALVKHLGVALDPGGYIHVNERMETSLPGIFAAGDLVTHAYSIEQISTAVGLGARAASSVFAYLKHAKAPALWGKSQINGLR